MSAFEVQIGSASFLQPTARIRLVAQSSVDVLAEASHPNGPCFSLSSFLDSDFWTGAKACFSVLFLVSFGDELSFPVRSRSKFLEQLSALLSEAELWSQLQLRADVIVPCDDQKTDLPDSPVVRLEIRQQHTAHSHRSEQRTPNSFYACDTRNVKPPLGVPTVLLCTVNISLHFSCVGSTALVPRKRPRSEVEGFLDLFDHPLMPKSGMRELVVCDEKLADAEECQHGVSQMPSSEPSSELFMEDVDDTGVALRSTSNYPGSGETFADLFSSASGHDSDMDSFVFSSQGSKLLQAQDPPPSVAASDTSASLHISSMNSLVDGALRNLICSKPVRTAPGIRTDTTDLAARLIDIAPSIFSPGYTEAVAARAPLVPTVARFLTSFLLRARSCSATTKKDEMMKRLSNMRRAESLDSPSQDQDEEMRLKETVKTHLWMTMTNGLRDPEPARRLKPLKPFAKSETVHSDVLRHADDIAAKECSFSSRIYDNELSWEDHGAGSGSTCYEAQEKEEMLDFDEDADDYADDLFEVYEEGLRNPLNHGNVLEPSSSDVDVCVGGRFTSYDSPSHNHSPILNTQQEPRQREPAANLLDTEFAQMLNYPSASQSGSAPATSHNALDDKWSNLLDEEPFPQHEVAGEEMVIPQSNVLIEDDWEPDFERWEFDLEEGSDEMLF